MEITGLCAFLHCWLVPGIFCSSFLTATSYQASSKTAVIGGILLRTLPQCGLKVRRGDAPSSCEPYLTKLNQYLGEAFSISGAAYDVLVKLTDRTKTETEFVTLSELRLLDNIFGIDLYDYSRKDVDQVPESVVESFKVIKAVYQAFTPNALKSRTPKPRLYCDSTFLVWTDTAYTSDGVKVPQVPFSQIADSPTAKSAFWYTDKKESSSVMQVSKCANHGTRGFNVIRQNTIALCPDLLNRNLGYQAIDVGTRDPNTGQVTRTSQDSPLDSFGGLAAVWLHEMTHLIGNSMENDVIDQPGYDSNEQPLPQIKDKDGSIPRTQIAYDFIGVTNPASGNPAKAKFNADSYAYFALGCYLNKWDWGIGFAMPLMVDIPPKPGA